jgi:crotonobetainyl-CoA:carnitine CoA-transferase CaiB-like acyl-CoA transferase
MGEYDDGHTRKDEAYARLREAFASRPTDEWIRLLDGYGVWCGPVYDYEDLVADPHVREAGLIAEQPNAAGGSIRTVRVPVSLSETPTAIRRGAPSLGADTAQILAQVAGYDDDQVELLARDGAIAVSDAPRR